MTIACGISSVPFQPLPTSRCTAPRPKAALGHRGPCKQIGTSCLSRSSLFRHSFQWRGVVWCGVSTGVKAGCADCRALPRGPGCPWFAKVCCGSRQRLHCHDIW
jgi:hypothetical protein